MIRNSGRAPIVAELGRPETPDETAARKAQASRNYRSSQTFRGLIAALLVTLAVVFVIVLVVPRGESAGPRPVDLSSSARNAESALGRPVLVPAIPSNWRVNKAELIDGKPVVWDVTVAPEAPDARGFAHIAQAFDADKAWAAVPLKGTASKTTLSIGGREWDVFELAGAAQSGNVTSGLGTQVGTDYVLIYGALTKTGTEELAAKISPQLSTIGAKK